MLSTMSEQTESHFSPSDFMRGRRPELYSDSTYSHKKELDSALFEYHLDTITARKQEYEFERFCTLLAEKELCPNLLPQTGPTGGGDSKVDSETYPVADAISANWYEGVAREAGKERWAFAFSAKKEWRGKVRSDVKKIAGTNRGYTVVYFMSNQFVSDKKRSDMEDELSSKYPFTVRIIDRTWIVETVVKKGYEEIASEALGLSADYTRTRHIGALDAEREEVLKEIDELVTERANSLTKYALAEEVLKSAFCARELERPKTEVYARFDRAIALAIEVGHESQIIRCKYQKAWTAFWWYEDYETLNCLYDEVEALVLATTFAEEYEYLVNLFTVSCRSVTAPDQDTVNSRKSKLLERLELFSNEGDRPNNALYARSLSVSIQLQDALRNEEKLVTVFQEIKLILQKSETITGFPVTMLIRIIREIGEFLPDLEIIDEVFDLAGNILEKNSSEESTVDLLIDRASHKLTHDKPYEALAKIEAAIDRSVSHDARETRVRLLLIASRIYKSIGLLWASRSSAVLALEQLFNEFADSGFGVGLIQKTFRSLIWTELELGRIVHVLNVHHLLLNFVGKYGDPEKDLENEEYMLVDPVFAMLISKTLLNDLEPLSTFLQALEEHQLYLSHTSLLYALGYEDEVIDSLKEVFKTREELEQNFQLWPKQPAYQDLPSEPILFRDDQGVISSRVLGVKVVVSFEKHDSAITFSETLLASLEAMLARYLNEQVYPFTEEIKIHVCIDESVEPAVSYEFFDAPSDIDLRIKIPTECKYGALEERHKYREVIFEILVSVMVRIIRFANGEETIREVVEKTKSSTAMAMILSDMFVITMATTVSNTDEWLPVDVEEATRKLIRVEQWKLGQEPEDTNAPLTPGEGEMPEELLDNSQMKHSDREVVSYIKPQLWDKAKWGGTAYGWEKTMGMPPFMMFMFRNGDAGKQIFEDWIMRLGKTDSAEKLRITIIRGINKKEPHNYKVLVSANMTAGRFSSNKQVLIVTRINLMTPENSLNLKKFIGYYESAGFYFLVPAAYDEIKRQIKPYMDVMIRKTEVNIRWAWEIGMNDPDIAGLSPDDDPYIPDGEKNPPITEVLKTLRKM
jgi:hypothetical protein